MSNDFQRLAKGIWAASLTPLDGNLHCDGDALEAHCSDLVRRGCRGVVLFGTTGEGPSFSVSEKIEILEKLITKGFPAAKIVLGNGSGNVSDTADLARAATKVGCAAMLIAPPAFFKNVSENGVLAYYRQILQKVSCPFLVYHLPQYTGVSITLSIIETLLREFPREIIGIKESEGNPLLARKFIDAFPSLQVFVGKESQIAETTAHGGAGSICGIANLYPEKIVSLYENGRAEGLMPIFEALKGVPFICAAKAILEERHGPVWHAVRPPLVPLDPQQKKSLILKT